MKPLQHSHKTVRKFGGHYEDYMEIHNFLDQTKAHVPDMRHRLILHNSFGIYLCEQMFGDVLVNSDDTPVSVRAIAETHILDDMGFIPTLSKCLEDVELKPGAWFGGKVKNRIK